MAFIIPKDQGTINQHFRSMITLSDGKNMLVFDCNPKINETTNVTYNNKNMSLLPTSINYFDSVSARTFNLSDIKFISRTRQEAQNNNNAIYYLRYLTKPNFGMLSNGLPPKVLLLSGFNSSNNSESVGALNSIPVVITNLDIDWPNDCDFIPDNNGVATPIIRTGSISLLEFHSPKQISEFDLQKFLNGQLLGW